MKKIAIFLFFLLAINLAGKTQNQFNPELIANVFGELSTDKNLYGHSYGADLRLMLGTDRFRIGPYGHYLTNYTVNGAKETRRYYYEDFNRTFGISIDSWKEGLPLNRYWWLNVAYRWSNDHGSDGLYEEWQKDGLFFLSGGLKLISPFEGWFSNWLVMIEYQTPVKSSITALYKGDTIKNAEPFNKERARINLEIGIKKIPVYIVLTELYFQPNLLLGFGWERNANRKYGEIGVGFSIGENLDYYHEYGGIKVFKRFDISHSWQADGSTSPYLSSWQIGAYINLNWRMNKKINNTTKD